MISLKQCHNQEDWDDYVLENEGHPLQLWGWGETKAQHGWKAQRYFALDMDHKRVGAVQMLIRKLPPPFNALVYVPRGPVTNEHYAANVLDAIANHAKSHHKAVSVSIEPDWEKLPPIPHGWKKSKNTILIPNTLILDLKKSEDELLEKMSKKTRQYIRKSGKEVGLEVRQVKSKEDLVACMQIYHDTANRAGFALHDDKYYFDVFENLQDASPVFAAYKDKKPVAFLWLAISAHTAFELYGGMDQVGQELRANYALKWHAICKMKEWGIVRYDMNGLVSDGVSNFKRGFADHEDKLVGTYDRALSPLYVAWTKGLPMAKKIVRSIKR